MLLCPRVDHTPPKDFDESLMLNDALLDMHEQCRLRHNALVEFERKRK